MIALRDEGVRGPAWVIGASVAAALTVAIVSATLVVDTDLNQGIWRAFAKTTQSINPLAAVACVLTAVAVAVFVTHAPSAATGGVALSFQSAAVAAIVAIPALLTAETFVDESAIFVLPAAVIAVSLLVAMYRPFRRIAPFVGALVGAVTIAQAAAFVDNSASPVHVAVAFTLLLVPLGIRLVSDRTMIATSLAVVHVIGALFVLPAAAACEDDDCLPTPPWFLALGMAAIWLAASQVRGQAATSAPPMVSPAPDAGVTARYERDWLRALTAMTLPATVLAASAVAFIAVDFDRAPPTLPSASSQDIASIPVPLAWNGRSGCVFVAGTQTAGNLVSVCDARFERWVPGPLVLIQRTNGQAVFDPYRIETTVRRWDTFEGTIDSNVVLELDNERGTAAVTARRPDQAPVVLFEGTGDFDYAVRETGVSSDGGWAYMLDSASRLFVAPTDGSVPARMLATDVRPPVQWMPEFAEVATLSYPLTERRPLRNPQDVDDREFAAAHRAIAESMGLDLRAELVVADERVYVAFENLSLASGAPDGYCLSVTTFLESARSVWDTQSVDVGGPVRFCDSSIGVLDPTCLSVVVPTLATVLDLERFEVVVVNAKLFVPGVFGSLTDNEAYFQLETGQVSPGAINPDDLRRVDPDDFCHAS